MRSFRLHRPPCPACGSSKTFLVRGVWSYTKLVIAACCVAVLNTGFPTPVVYRCRACGERFRADPDADEP